ncbi:MAG: hypothetical protein CL908_27225 [Deltaproteobacteria bacterium]|nr:hypothetical protein [Deltaproteobacteria bacterium]
MLRHERSAPIWLFSFVDLAFLLLIAFTQIGPDMSPTAPDVGQIEIPRIASAAAPFSGSDPPSGWQLRVHRAVVAEASAIAHTPFELIEPGRAAASADSTQHIDAEELAARLELLRERQFPKPLLAPHRDSRSEDLLVAVGLLESSWQTERTVAVVPAKRVSSGPARQVRKRQ